MNISDYYDYNESDADAIVEDACTKLRELIYSRSKKSVDSHMKSLEMYKKANDTQMEENKKLAQQLVGKDLVISKLKEQLKLRNPVSKFAPGDSVFYCASKQMQMNCPVCLGSGRFIVRTAEGYWKNSACPNCQCYSRNDPTARKKTRVEFSQFFPAEGIITTATVAMRMNSSIVTYNIDTRLGSLPECRVFANKADCAAHCEELNNEALSEARKLTGCADDTTVLSIEECED